MISMPRNLEPATDSKIWPCNRYWLGIYLYFTPYPTPAQGPAVESDHLLSWRLPSKWPCHLQTNVPWTLIVVSGRSFM